LALLAVEDLRSAAILVRSYLSEIENVPGPTGGGRSNDELKAGYLDKTDGVTPSHAILCSMLVRICEKDTKTAPLFTWLVRNFGQELGTMHDPEAVRAYTMKIGRVYFDIQPPPSDDGEHDVRHGGGLGCAFRPVFRFIPVLIFRNSGFSAEFPDSGGTHTGIKSFQGKINLD
jgi:hypothetical protein